MIQLDLFHEFSEVEILEERIRQVEKSLDKQRKALFSKNGELSKAYIQLNDRLEILERNICKGKIPSW